MKFHINGRGEPGACRATVKDCPLGGADKHYGSEQEAREAYEASQSVFGNSVSKIKESGTLTLESFVSYLESFPEGSYALNLDDNSRIAPSKYLNRYGVPENGLAELIKNPLSPSLYEEKYRLPDGTVVKFFPEPNRKLPQYSGDKISNIIEVNTGDSAQYFKAEGVYNSWDVSEISAYKPVERKAIVEKDVETFEYAHYTEQQNPTIYSMARSVIGSNEDLKTLVHSIGEFKSDDENAPDLSRMVEYPRYLEKGDHFTYEDHITGNVIELYSGPAISKESNIAEDTWIKVTNNAGDHYFCAENHYSDFEGIMTDEFAPVSRKVEDRVTVTFHYIED